MLTVQKKLVKKDSLISRFFINSEKLMYGMINKNIIRFLDEPLLCFNYRAWGRGQPSHSKGCVTLVQPPQSQLGPFWKVVPCGSVLSFICEISPIYSYLHS